MELDNLQKIKQALNNNERFLHIKGHLKLTKTQLNFCEVLLERDTDPEQRTRTYIEHTTSLPDLLQRYRQPSNQVLPTHIPMKILSGVGPVCAGNNIFMFFPYVLNQTAQTPDDHFGFEFIDIWSHIFNKNIFPCLQLTCDLKTQLYFHSLLKNNLDRTIYLSSIFHELGHQVGPWQVSPTIQLDMKVTGFELDILGELATDSLLVTNLREYPEVAAFVILQRLFWFGRRGFKENPVSGMAQTDNDSWISLYLWQKLRQHQVLNLSHGKISFLAQNVNSCFQQILEEIDSLYSPELSKDWQVARVKEWMQNSVPHTETKNEFIYPIELQNIFFNCQSVEEVPHFMPSFHYTQITELKEILL